MLSRYAEDTSEDWVIIMKPVSVMVYCTFAIGKGGEYKRVEIESRAGVQQAAEVINHFIQRLSDETGMNIDDLWRMIKGGSDNGY